MRLPVDSALAKVAWMCLSGKRLHLMHGVWRKFQKAFGKLYLQITWFNLGWWLTIWLITEIDYLGMILLKAQDRNLGHILPKPCQGNVWNGFEFLQVCRRLVEYYVSWLPNQTVV